MKASTLTKKNKGNKLEKSNNHYAALLIAFIIILALFSYALFYNFNVRTNNAQIQNENNKEAELEIAKKETKNNVLIGQSPKAELPEGRQVYFIKQDPDSSRITEAVINPLKVKVGDAQEMSLKVEDNQHTVISVIAVVETDSGLENYALKLTEGTDSDGVWNGSWIVHDTHFNTYKTTSIAANSAGGLSSATLTWSDPCSPPNSGTWNLDGNCIISGVNGVDNGDFIVSNGYTLTIQADSTFVWNPGRSINYNPVGGTIAVNTGGQLKQGYLCMIDKDRDGYPASLTQYFSSSETCSDITNGRRRKDILSPSIIDENDDSSACAPACSSGCTTRDYYQDTDASTASFVGNYCEGSNPLFTAWKFGDCAPSDARAHPNLPVGLYYSTPRNGVGGYDFDCDGSETLRTTWTLSASLGCVNSRSVSGLGWVDSVPSCGQSGVYRTAQCYYGDDCIDSFPGEPAGNYGATLGCSGGTIYDIFSVRVFDTSLAQPCR